MALFTPLEHTAISLGGGGGDRAPAENKKMPFVADKRHNKILQIWIKIQNKRRCASHDLSFLSVLFQKWFMSAILIQF